MFFTFHKGIVLVFSLWFIFLMSSCNQVKERNLEKSLVITEKKKKEDLRRKLEELSDNEKNRTSMGWKDAKTICLGGHQYYVKKNDFFPQGYGYLAIKLDKSGQPIQCCLEGCN